VLALGITDRGLLRLAQALQKNPQIEIRWVEDEDYTPFNGWVWNFVGATELVHPMDVDPDAEDGDLEFAATLDPDFPGGNVQFVVDRDNTPLGIG